MRATILAGLAIFLFVVPSLAESPPLTLEDIRTRTERLLSQDTTDSANDYWTDSEIDDWINDGQAFVAERARCLVRETTIVIVARQDEYNMPSDFISIISTKRTGRGATASEDVSAKGMKRSEGADIGATVQDRADGMIEYEDVGQTEAFMRVIPMPVKGDTVNVKYAAYPDTLSGDASQCDLPRSFQNLLPMYAAWKCWAKTRTSVRFREDFFREMTALEPTQFKLSEPLAPEERP